MSMAGADSFEVEQTNAVMNRVQSASPDKARGSRRVSAFLVDAEGLTYEEVVMNFCIGLIGGGVLVFPATMAGTGFILGPVLLMACSGFLYEAGVLLCKTCDAAETFYNLAPGSILDYESLAGRVAGPAGQRLLAVTKNGAFLSFVLFYVKMIASAVVKLYDIFSGNEAAGGTLCGQASADAKSNETKVMFFVVLPVFIALSLIKDLKMLAKFSLVGIFAVSLQVFAVLGGSAQFYASADWCLQPDTIDGQSVMRLTGNPKCLAYSSTPITACPDDSPNYAGPLATFVFAFAILGTVPSVRSQMAKPNELPSALGVSFLIVTIAYLMLMCCGYFGFGEDVNSTVTLSLPRKWSVAAQLAVIVNVLLSTPMFTVNVYRFVESLGDGPLFTPLNPVNIAFRAGLGQPVGESASDSSNLRP